MKQNTYTRYTVEIDDYELPISFKMPDSGPEAIHTFNEDQTKFLIVYAVQDQNCDSPLDSSDGMGRLLLRGRYGNDEAEMLKVLGLDSDGSPNLTLIPEALIRHELARALTRSLTGAGNPDWEGLVEYLEIDDAVTWADENTLALDVSRQKILEEVKRVAACGYFEYVDQIWEYLDHDVSLEQMWEISRAEGWIGDPYAVLLDVYDHGGTHWSISGSGTQCRWDTSIAAGLWVPDRCARDEADRRAKVYAKGRVISSKGLMRGRGRFHAVTEAGESSGLKDTWHEAFQWLEAQDVAVGPHRDIQGRLRAAEELAQEALDQYNAWCAGDCWGVIVEELELVDGEWRQVSEDSCWGYVGGDYTEEVMRGEFESRVAAYQTQMA